MPSEPYRVLFLCTGNSARSQMAEALLNRLGEGRFRAYSAGSHPADAVHPLTLEMLERAGLETAGLRTKSWDELAEPGAPALEFVFTVCDKAAAEPCPVWPGQALSAHWGFPDPAGYQAATEAERRVVFADVFRQIQNRIRLLVSLPMDRLDRLSLQRRLDEIGESALDSSDPNAD
ncbi:arsenate reductase ArsC [Thiohalorhabdus sp. Cl-TMA]|uniref:Arsenate reductase ArsC n=1 Tax=Thiohalorhabdus methylotrophus TaxID=3242694 RepID=A0ABV4TSL2_9GAMM